MERIAVGYRLPDDAPLRQEVLPPGVTLREVVVDDDPAARPQLRAALALIGDGVADTLVLVRVRSASRSLTEVVRLLDWLAHAGATLISLAPALDTATVAGAATISVLAEIDSWGRAADDPRPRGRPGLRHARPELGERIGALRAAGLSLQAIADTLNREQVPTPRGGRSWRPSSVQSALGYRRPRPPLPGAPPHKPRPRPHHPPPAPPHRDRTR